MAGPDNKTRLSPTPKGVLESVSLPADLDLTGLESGKVRDRYLTSDGQQLVLITTDRMSAFDSILGTVPGKGQILNALAAYWFEKTADIIPNHMLAVPDPNVMVVKKTSPLPVEVVVRGYMTGITGTSVWGSYARGEREIYGIHFREGYRKNDPLDTPVITPTTKAAHGNDQRLTEAEIRERKIVEESVWEQVRTSAVALFKRGQEISARKGFILVDTKLEFGLDEAGQPVLIDELFTPDSSRFWLASTCAQRRSQGAEPDNYDKEYLRLAYASLGYPISGPFPAEVPQQIREETARRYRQLCQAITEKPVYDYPGNPQIRIAVNLKKWLAQNPRL